MFLADIRVIINLSIVLLSCLQFACVGAAKSHSIQLQSSTNQSPSVKNEAILGKTLKKHEPLNNYTEINTFRKISKPVGRLTILRSGNAKPILCTAALISDGQLLTSHHCVDDIDQISKVILRMGYYNETDLNYGEEDEREYVVDKEPAAAGGGTFPQEELDYAVLNVRGSPGAKWGTVVLSTAIPDTNDSLVVIHHPNGKEKRITRGGCIAKGVVGKILKHNCDTELGSSGAPIFDEKNRVVAIHKGHDGDVLLNQAPLVNYINNADQNVREVINSQSNVEPPKIPYLVWVGGAVILGILATLAGSSDSDDDPQENEVTSPTNPTLLVPLP